MQLYVISPTHMATAHGIILADNCAYLGSVHLKSVEGGPENGGGGGHANSVLDLGGGPSKFRIGFGGGHVNSAYVEKSLWRIIIIY